MTLSKHNRQHIAHLADETLDMFESISTAAEHALRSLSGDSQSALANVNTITSTQAIQKLNKISSENRDDNQMLCREPAIARVIVNLESGDERTYFICRAAPVAGVGNLASYRAPVGRLAALPVGESLELPNGDIVVVSERAQLRPEGGHGNWDALDTIVQNDELGSVTVPSMRALLNDEYGVADAEDILSQLLAEESEGAEIINSIRRGVITKMGLRDQPILDQYQDEIFRLPLDERLLIIGPPGTGKTTTLIRRLGQKLELAFLEDEEKELVGLVGSNDRIPHTNSWLMFTPTELLKQYLKESFNREGVPAPDLRIRTWNDYRRELARNVFGILRTATTKGPFVLKEDSRYLNSDCLSQPITWFDDFLSWQREQYINRLSESANVLAKQEDKEVSDIGKRLEPKLAGYSNLSLYGLFNGLAAEHDKLREMIALLKADIDNIINGALNLQLNRDRRFIDDFADFLSTLGQSTVDDADELEESEDLDELDEEEGDDDTEASASTKRAAAVLAYKRAIRTKARSIHNRKNISSTTRMAKILAWLNSRIPSDDDLSSIGTNLSRQKHSQLFINPVKRYLKDIPKSYKQFRRLKLKDNTWYAAESIRAFDLSPLELDLILLAIMKNANALLSNSIVIRDIDSATWSELKYMRDLHINQVLVDEATDFSPIQIACMGALAHPRLRSFFACGDFNQRLTTWGSRSIDDLKWAIPDINLKEVSVSYRQSRQLNEFSHGIIKAVGGADQLVALPKDVDNEGVEPVLLEHCVDGADLGQWLANRIIEIERFCRQLPSVAIFVVDEVNVQPMADRLNGLLEDHNTRVIACPKGQVMGQDGDIRVFDIQHIKGLEFEAVFFIGVDSLALLHPELFDKYIYVGATRAATYLGLTCESVLPEKLDPLRPMFVDHWATM